jgi:predicted nucleic-acid-binding protein
VIGIDTNVLVRYLVRDDQAQTARATAIIETRCSPDAPGFVCHVVLAELVWVLARGYRYSKPLILAVLRRILAAAELKVEDPPLVWQALADYEQGSADLADYLIGRRNQASGCLVTFSFDCRTHGSGLFADP